LAHFLFYLYLQNNKFQAPPGYSYILNACGKTFAVSSDFVGLLALYQEGENSR